VVSTIEKTVKEGEKAFGYWTSEVAVKSIPSQGDAIVLFQTEAIDYGRGPVAIKLVLNEEALKGQTVETLDERISKSSTTVANNLVEAMWHECGHAKIINGKSAEEVQDIYENLENKGVQGVSTSASDDGVEALAEAEVLLRRGEELPKELKALYDSYYNHR
jgi:hypothetical protein